MKHFFNSFSLELITFLGIFFSQLQSSLWTLGFLIFIDTVLGIWAAIRTGGWESITSRKAGRIITKIVLYPLAIIVAKASQDYLAPSIPWTSVSAGIIATVELKSIYEKMSILLGFELWQTIKKTIWKDKEPPNPPKI